MLNYVDLRGVAQRDNHHCMQRYDYIDVYDGDTRIGRIKLGTDGYYLSKGYKFCVYGVDPDDDFGRDDFVGRAKNVADGKRIISEWYEKQEKSRFRSDVKFLPASDSEFYPTPSRLAAKLAAYVDWTHVSTVLEPSAGKGDLIECAEKCVLGSYKRLGFRVGEYSKDRFDCIEIDPNLRMVLKGKGYRVVSDDFLLYDSPKHYDVIIMNPPFSNGDEHLLHAIEMQSVSGGQISCLLNAETIRNPYTNRRKILQSLLQKYAAKIEFVSGAFMRAERKSDVEVAIVYLNIPKPRKESNILKDLKRANDVKIEDSGDPTAVAKGNWAERMVENYEFEAKAGIALMEEYNAIAPYIMSGSEDFARPLIQLEVRGKPVSSCGAGVVNDYLKGLRAKYWASLMNRRELTDRMTSAMRDDFHSKIGEMADYDFTFFNVQSLVLELGSQLTKGVEDSIMQLFDDLSAKHAWYPECENNIHYYNGWATNKAHKVGMKCIIPLDGFYANWDGKKTLESYKIVKTIEDLERSLNYLDRGDTDIRFDVSSVARNAEAGQVTKLEFTYFTAQFYKKGTCHIKFRESAAPLIDRLNIFASMKRSWLPPSYGKKKYENMSAEEKAVIDEFQGEEAYRKVVSDPGNYIFSAENSIPLLSAAV